ncbi:unnamed protein product [Leptidea sinapis]|uniref:AAA+ ATPase domain-containing protein n=1 Tax=Leptidea sinapis TaxID=189913 RepID=A0A5E4QNV3_9NEOP|nr:unnamed protein product [Leptidea sinapis]
MADEAGGPAPPGVEITEAEDEEKAANVAHAAGKIDEISKRMSRKESAYHPTIDDEDVLNIDRTALEAILDVSSRITDIQKKSKISMSTLVLAHDTYKEKQAKAKEARNNRVGGLKTQHRFLLENAALILNKSIEYVLDGVYDADIHIDLLDSAVAEGGRNCIVLCDAWLPPLKMESGRFVPNQKGLMERTYISDAATMATEGICIGMYRIKNKAIDIKNVAEDYYLVFFDINQESENIVSGIYNTMKRVYIPALGACRAWGDLNPPNPKSDDIIRTYVSKIMLFNDYLAKTKIDLDCCTKFKINLLLYEEELADAEKMKLAITKTHVLEEICTFVKQWMKQITMVLVQSQQLRREPSNIGPLAELDHWRRQLTTFTSIIEHIKSEPCQMYIHTLIRAKSKLIKVRRCASFKYAEYFNLRMIFATSRYYNTTKQISTLLVKVTNQILNMCLDYLTVNKKKTIWNQDKLNFITKSKLCLNLYSFYRECYNETQREMMEAADERPFDCSEMYIFGKFETFRKRLMKIIDLFQTYITYYVLNKTTLEGIEEYAANFNKLFKAISTKTYDALDHRRPDFDKDYKIYKDGVATQELLLENFMIASVNKCPTTEIALYLLKRFEKLKLDCLYLEDQYYDLISNYTAEIESIRDRYNEERENPELPRNMPPVAGRVMWIRFYNKNIKGPMKEFMQHHEVRLGLIAPLLIRHPTTNMYIVNFSIYIPECIREVEYMWQLGLSVPDSAQIVAFCKNKIFANFERMKHLVERNDQIRRSMPKLYLPLLRAQLIKMEKAFQAGLSTITWVSLEIPAYCEKIESVLDEVDLFVKESMLVFLPEKAVDPNVFYEENLVRRDDIAMDLQQKSCNAEVAVIELINKFLDSVPSKAIQDLKDNWLDLDKALKPVTSATRVFPEDAAGSRSGSSMTGIRNYFRMVSEHKDIVRAVMALQGMMYMYKPDIEKLLTNLKLGLHVESVEWKRILGKLLSHAYKERVDKMMQFIKDRMKTMSKKIKDLDDVRVAMLCLELIREEFIGMDMELDLIEESYATFVHFNVDIPKDDMDMVYGLRYAFQNMLLTSQQVQQRIVDMQGPLQKELTDGVATFNEDVLKFDADYDRFGPLTPGLTAREASDRVIMFQSRFDELWRRFEMYSNGEKLFGMEVKDYPILHQKKKEFNLLSKLYSLYLSVMNSIDGYFETPWAAIDIETIIAQLADFDLRCRKLPRGMKDWPAYIELKTKIDDFNQTCPLLELMADKAMKDRHWRRLENLMHCVLDVESESFTLANVMEAPLLKYKEDVEDICISAVKEKDIEAKLKQTISDWAVVDLAFANFKNRGELLIKPQDTLDIITMLEDSLMILNSLASNRYNAPFKKDILLWINKLVNTTDILEKWLSVQNLWMYLEAVFVGGDIAKQLPAEAKRFATIDKTYVKIMYRARDIVNCVDTCTSDDTLKQLLPHLMDQLEACQKSLTGYLETKRLIFPRFFFVSDPVLLEILGQASDPHSIQPHLPSIFDAMYMVDFDDKERIIWLNTLLDTMKDTVRNFIAFISQTMAGDPEFEFLVSFWNFSGQASLLGMQILWTSDAEYALKKARADRLIMRLTNQKFLDLLNGLIDQTVRDIAPLDRTRIETMITIHVHQRDIFDDLVRMRIKSPNDFEWQKQARFYYYEDTDDCIVSITDVDFLYQNEYLGITERLVITPLTDRCYITLSQAIGMSMGGAPAGPAGTGKTETTKDMARTLGKLVIVFNCSDQMDFRGLGRIYKGLAQSGTWGCFDEFNRIELPVLSVAAQQIYICLTARREKKEFFIFSLNPEFAFIITMNPGYAGRQELPENLKIQFRSVAMMVPDRQIIIRVKLASCGFKDNILLARKFFTLYKLCEEQLSKQVHYDFGLRNILSVLRTMGSQKRANPESTEENIMMRVLKEMNVSKLVDEDEPLFVSLIEDLFPGIKLSQTVHREMQRAINVVTERTGLVNHPDWNLKIIQLYETSLVRHGLMTMGPTGSGKTTCIHTLMAALTEVGKPHREMRMNPKAITAPQMFGRLDVATNDWTDGIFSTLWRRALKVKKTDTTWIVLDGPVDAVWIENLNSVLDDNKTLTLANGDRISMAQNSKLVFEPDNVDNASPATVSRMGMVFLSSSVLKWQPILEGWLKKRTQKEYDLFRSVFNKVYDDVHLFVQQKLPAKMKLLEAIYVRQCIDVLIGLLQIEVPGGKVHTDRHLERLFVFAMMWSLGAVLELDARFKMAEFMTKLPVKIDWPGARSKEWVMPFDYMVNETESVEDYIYPQDSVPEYASILVPNVDNVCISFLIETIAKQNKAVLLIGEQGTAKTVMLKSYMAKYNNEVKLFKMINFSSATTPNMFQKPGEFIIIADIQMFGAMIHPGGGRNDVPPRLKRQFNIFNCTLPSNVSMDKIFETISAGYFCKTRFDKKFVDFMPRLVPVTRMIWQQTKFHYVFNLRDLSRIWESILFIKRDELPSIKTALKLWFHECLRVISDRFTTFDDKDWFVANFWKIATRELPDLVSEFPDEETYFVNFLREPVDPTGDEEEDFSTEAPKIYEELPSWEFLLSKLAQFQDQFNEQIRGAHLDLVFFHDAMVHLFIISRIINTPRGNALLVGVGGSGKQSLTKLASYIANFSFYQITLTRAYNVSNFMDDIKILYRIAGLQGQGISFIFTDNDIKDEQFLEFLNNILNEILNELTPIMKKYAPKRIPVPDVLYEYFIMRSRSNLHVVLCFSPVGEKFRSRAMKFPGLISGSTMDWFQKWPRTALIEVAHHFLWEFKDNVADTCSLYFDRFRRQTHVTPKSYLSFLEGYKVMTTGLDKLVEAAASVDVLKKELEAKDMEIKEATAAAEEAAAEVVKAEVMAVKDRAVKLVSVIAAETAIAEEKLAAAKPALDAAEAALLLGKPPYLITLIMDAVILLFRKKIDPIKPDPEKQFLTASWAESLKVMADTRFLNNLKFYPKDEINAEMLDLLTPYFSFPQYTFEAAKIACGNVAGLISWTKAMASFYSVNKDVLPLKANLAVMQGKYQAAKRELEAAEALLEAKERELKGVQMKFDEAMTLKQAVLDDAAKCQQKMDAATALINGLSGERVRWTEQSALFRSEIERLVGDILLLTGFLSYSGPFNQEFRSLLNNSWLAELLRRKIPVSMSLNITEQLTDTATIGDWNLCGLPTDELSIQNGIIVKLGDKEIDVTAGHKIYITTKLPNPAYTPEISARTSIIDFTVTMQEKAEMEAERTQLIMDVTANRRKMQELEANLLHKLTTIQGSLVEDTYDVWKFISRGFYETHKYLFTLLLTLKIDLNREVITYDEFQTLIKGGAALDLNACPPKPFKWVTDMAWLNLVNLSGLRQFTNILTQVSNNEKGWKNWKLLVVRSVCPDRTLAQSLKYVINSMGARFSEAVIANYENMVLESRPLVPLIGFLAMGSDPTPSIEVTAKRMECICSSISMGQGQEVHARKLIDRGIREFAELEKEPEKVHETFRLWITTEVHNKFPITLLQMSIKYTCEPPSGIKAGLMRTYDSMSQDFLDYSDSPFYLPLIYTISFLHTVVQERRKFGPLGWNIPYEFNSADWLSSCMFVQNHLDILEPGQNYGGRVTDDYDNRLLTTFCRVWLTDQIFNDDFQFYKNYGIMKFKNIPEYIEEIEKMKTVDPPQAYGLHTNADITYQRQITQDLLDTILSIQPKESSSGGGETREASVYRQSKEMLDKVPPNFDPHEVKERLRYYGMLNSMVIFLRQEIDRMQKVISLVRTTLKDLLLAIDGTIIMNEALRDSLDNIYDAKVPKIWLRSSWTSSTLGFWFTEFLERNIQFSTWCFQARPYSFWMTGFFNPQGFLTAMRQEVTRAHKGWALDMVALHNDEGVYVHGLFLDGSSWDRRNQRLSESMLKVLYTALPVVHIYAINSTAPKDPKLYECPVYKKPNRTGLTFITPLWLPTLKHPDHWVLRGVAILCDIK